MSKPVGGFCAEHIMVGNSEVIRSQTHVPPMWLHGAREMVTCISQRARLSKI